MDKFIHTAKDRYGYNAEQALGMLLWHKHNMDRALEDLGNFTPFPDEWSVVDKVLFEQAFQVGVFKYHQCLDGFIAFSSTGNISSGFDKCYQTKVLVPWYSITTGGRRD